MEEGAGAPEYGEVEEYQEEVPEEYDYSDPNYEEDEDDWGWKK